MLTVLLGGARSGKSSLAAGIGRRHEGDVVYVATSPHIAGDHDLDGRIAAHRAERPASWRTIEEELDLRGAIADAGDAFVIVDCLTLWLNNLIHHGADEMQISTSSRAALDIISQRKGDTVVITNEVGLGIVPDNDPAPPASDSGLGISAARSLRPLPTIAGLFGGVGLVSLATGWWVGPFMAAAVVGAAATVWLAVRKIGGLAGDVLGAVEQVVECLVLIVASGLAARHTIWWA